MVLPRAEPAQKPAPSPDLEAQPSWGLEVRQEITKGRAIIEALGGGRDVEVFLVWDEHLFSLAVAKILRPHKLHEGSALSRLRREGELLMRLTHPSLLRGYEVAIEGEYPHLLLEYAEGRTLRSLVRRYGPLATEQWIPSLAHLAGALQYLSNERLAHLDLKPANIVMGLRPKLLDFGISRSFEAASKLRSAIGTTTWMAPEQFDPVAAGGIGPAADVWGLGATLHYAITGKAPFPKRQEGAPASQLEGTPRPLPPNVPAELAALLRQMLSKDPKERPTPRTIATAVERELHGRSR